MITELMKIMKTYLPETVLIEHLTIIVDRKKLQEFHIEDEIGTTCEKIYSYSKKAYIKLSPARNGKLQQNVSRMSRGFQDDSGLCINFRSNLKKPFHGCIIPVRIEITRSSPSVSHDCLLILLLDLTP